MHHVYGLISYYMRQYSLGYPSYIGRREKELSMHTVSIGYYDAVYGN